MGEWWKEKTYIAGLRRIKMSDKEKIGDDIYQALEEIQKEEEVKLSDRAFITDCLSQKLHKLGYCKPSPELRDEVRKIIFDGINKDLTTWDIADDVVALMVPKGEEHE